MRDVTSKFFGKSNTGQADTKYFCKCTAADVVPAVPRCQHTDVLLLAKEGVDMPLVRTWTSLCF